jgi:TolB-like protein/Tfp pilus assembly protein PilF
LASVGSTPGPLVREAQVRAQLDRMLGSSSFRKTARLARLLRYLVESTLDGRGAELKESVLGIEVFERGSSFDPRVDTLVRSTARHLRFKIEEYYKLYGQNDAVIVELPKGTYVPKFHARATPEANWRPWRILIAAALILAVAAVAATRWNGWRPAADPTSLVVLPFENRTGSGSDQYLIDGLTEELTNGLVRIRGLRVIGRTSAERVDRAKDFRQIGADLKVGTILAGSVERSGGQLRISARLIGATDGNLLWSDSFAAAPLEMEAVEQSIVEGATSKLHVAPLAPSRAAVDPEAHDLYIRGRFLWYKRDGDDIHKSIGLFDRAIAKDPSYALAYAGLADAYGILASYDIAPASETLPKAKAAASQALSLDPDLAQAHAALALVHNAEWQWQDAEKELRRAIEINPGFATAYQRLAMNRTVHGRFGEAAALLERAQTLEPLDWMLIYNLGENAYYARDYDGAIKRALELQPLVPTAAANLLTRSYTQKHMLAEARRASQQIAAFPAADLDRLVLLDNRAFAARAFRQQLVRRPNLPGFYLACKAAQFGQTDLALEYLEKALAAHDPDLCSMGVEPDLDPVRAEPRFKAVLERVGLSR